MLWMNHLEDLDALSESIGLRAYGQRDPLVEYRGEAHKLYQAFWANFGAWIFLNIFKLPPPGEVQEQKPSDQVVKILPKTAGAKEAGRNDPCPCGSGKKYKKCHGA
jgi:preprotein translocase subunit SecA